MKYSRTRGTSIWVALGCLLMCIVAVWRVSLSMRLLMLFVRGLDCCLQRFLIGCLGLMFGRTMLLLLLWLRFRREYMMLLKVKFSFSWYMISKTRGKLKFLKLFPDKNMKSLNKICLSEKNLNFFFYFLNLRP